MSIAVGIFAHNEAQRISRCLASLPAEEDETVFHVLVNGSTDRTAEVARAASQHRDDIHVHDFDEGGKSRTWNRFVYDIIRSSPDVVVFMDGDAELAPESIATLQADLTGVPHANAVAGLPLNGRQHAAYQQALRTDGGLFGDLYALRGSFVARIKAAQLRLPEDLIGDDGLVAALAFTDLGPDSDWDRSRIAISSSAGFLCEPTSLLAPATWQVQYKRMINYAERHFQNRIISDIMSRVGPSGLPVRLSALYAEWLPQFQPRSGLANQWFDRLALSRMANRLITTH